MFHGSGTAVSKYAVQCVSWVGGVSMVPQPEIACSTISGEWKVQMLHADFVA